MKKILTFLVMLLCSMSILTAQTAFNYQAVVRDQNSHNLVKNTDLTVEVTITTLTTLGIDTVVYQAFIPTRTTLNGMASFLIADEYEDEAEVEFEVEPVGMAAFNWTDAIIKCVFMDGETEIDTVETPVTAVPYALKADAGPITTDEIVRYIQDDLQKKDVKAIVDALVANEEVSDTIKDIIFKYAKDQKEMALDLALYFLGEVTPAYLHEAIDTLKQDTKDEIKTIIVDYLKNHKDMAVDVLAAYITQITKDDVEQLIEAAEQIPSTEKQAIAEYLIDFATDYIRNHHDLIQLAYTKLVDVVTDEDFENFYNYVKTTRNDIYQFMIARFDGYLVNYLNEHNYLQMCEESDLDFCGLVAEVERLQNSVNDCPDIESVEIRIENPTPTTGTIIYVDAKLKNVSETTLTSSNVSCSLNLSQNCATQYTQIQYVDGICTFRYDYNSGACTLHQGDTITATVKLIDVTLPTGCSLPNEGKQGSKTID